MSLLQDAKELVPKVVANKLSMAGLLKVPMPMVLTFSVTSACQSLCKTCDIGDVYLKNPSLRKDDLTIREIEKIFKNMGHIYFFNISGGEPFMRPELPEIVKLSCEYLTPRVVHTPTNGIMVDYVLKQTRKILEIMEEYDPKVPFTIKPSLDGIGEKHDIVRGFPGNFEKVMKTFNGLIQLKKEFKNLDVGLGTVISKFNINDIEEIVDFVSQLDLDTYISEIAENREEMFNVQNDITPDVADYEKAIKYFSDRVGQDLKNKKGLSKSTQAFRLVYYDLVVRIMKQKTQPIPCYAGRSNVHLTAKGELWPCCVLAYSKPLGNLKKENYDFKKIWYSYQAKQVRRYIKDKKCHCPFANQSYSNILINFRSMGKVIRELVNAR